MRHTGQARGRYAGNWRDHRHLSGQRLGRQAARHLQRILWRQHKAMRIVDRPILLHHRKARQGPQRSADQIERLPRRAVPVGTLQHLVHPAVESLAPLGAQRRQAQRAERQADAMGASIIGNVDQLKTAPAQVADDTLRARKGRQDAMRAGDRFFFPRQQPGRQAKRCHRGQKRGAIAGIAHRRRRHGGDITHAPQRQQGRKTGQRRMRGLHPLARQPAILGHALTQSRRHFFVEQHRRRTKRPAIDHHADSVRPNVDNRPLRIASQHRSP